MSMATGTDRYAPLREAASEPRDQKSEPTRQPSDERVAQDRTAAAHETRENDAAIGAEAPTRPTNLPYQSPGWTDRGGLVEHTQSAMEWIKASHERRQSAQQEADRDAPAPEQADQKRTLVFYEDRAAARTHNDLKVEHARNVGKEREGGENKRQEDQRSLKFYEDHEHDQGHTR
jgi:hypothetical protein